MLNEHDRKTPIAIRVIALDETEYFNIPSDLAPYIKEIHGVYFYDKNSHTFLCEMTPSYCLDFLYYNIVFVEGEFENDEDIRNEAYDFVEDVYNDGNPTYMHKPDIDALEQRFTEKNIKFRFSVEEDEMLPDDMEYDEYIEEVFEGLRANHVL